MKKIFFVTYFLAICTVYLFATDTNINFTGIDYSDVTISKKTKILNPIPIVYNEQKDKYIYNESIPILTKTAGYWISKIQTPDEVILNEEQIKDFNERIKLKDVGLTKVEDYKDIVNPDNLKKTLERRLFWIKNRRYIFSNLEKVPKEFFDDLQKSIDLDFTTPFTFVNFAITTKYSEVRILPTDTAIYSNPNSLDLDRLQEQSIDIGTPLAVLCQTKDRDWCYAVTPREEGWIKTENIAFTSRENIKEWNSYKKIAVATDTKADIFLDKTLKQFAGYVRMGTYFPLKSKNKKYVVVRFPVADKNGNLVITNGYIHRNSVNIGFLKYTQRNILIQAFKHLNSLYGWGGSRAEQDCSGMLGQIFNCFGVVLPENSAQKIKCGEIFELERYEDIDIKKQNIIEKAIPALSFIYLQGHIMLYIGNDDNEPYVLHNVWGVSAFNNNNEKTILYINRTIVGDLNLGDIVTDNSLIERVIKFSILK